MGESVLELKDVTVWRGDNRVFHGLSLRVESGERIAILGPNGAGKSTLLALISGDLHPVADRGEARLFGEEFKGFEKILKILKTGKLAKWSLLTIGPAYFRPELEVFVKPTTAKGIIKFFEITSLCYNPTPTWSFYDEYRNIINEMKSKVDTRLSPSNAAFCGFLMMTIKSQEINPSKCK